MFDIQVYDKHTKFGEYDYLIETKDELVKLYPVCMPKLQGEWLIVVVDPSIKDAKEILEERDRIPKFFNVTLFISQNKITDILNDYPEFVKKKKTNFEMFKEFISTLKHPITNEAASYAYKAANGNLDELEDSIRRIDTALEKDMITLKDIQSEFVYTKRIYTSQVVKEFLFKDRYRYSHYNTWLNELGMQYAYNSMYKTIKHYVKEKKDYLEGKDVKNIFVMEKVDNVTLSTLYLLFYNSTHYSQLESILYEFDQITNERLRRYLDARIQ